jgi:hypothetical protein
MMSIVESRDRAHQRTSLTQRMTPRHMRAIVAMIPTHARGSSPA